MKMNLPLEDHPNDRAEKRMHTQEHYNKPWVEDAVLYMNGKRVVNANNNNSGARLLWLIHILSLEKKRLIGAAKRKALLSLVHASRAIITPAIVSAPLCRAQKSLRQTKHTDTREMSSFTDTLSKQISSLQFLSSILNR
ncbi:hypothetical protein PIB30_026531 [Stylosanthes scabra]|uniref:Uncharacterized protein n=1 Tax=Stylosanthes scabra TaxID=79078 RepID=A0ABU6QB04_9FABA|nr:hypothetical protein [Stylosanthes scabra]